MSRTEYRAVIYAKKLRPYYPEIHRTVGYLKQYYLDDIKTVGDILDVEVGPYKSLNAVKGGITRALSAYPLTSIYGDGKKSTEVLEIRFFEAVYVLNWKEITDEC